MPLREVQSLVGVCNSLAQVKPQGYYQLSRLYAALVGLTGTETSINLSEDLPNELNIWKKWAALPGRVLLHNSVPRQPTHVGYSDAAGKARGGNGGVLGPSGTGRRSGGDTFSPRRSSTV